jgi:hypothetical protein
VEGMFVVLNGSVSIDVQMILAPYTVTFHVKDEKGAPVPYANVMMDNRTTTTNLQGVATLSARNGNYPYTIEKLGYDEYSNNVLVQGSNKDVYPELEFTVWTITVIVKDKENDLISNAIVKVNNGEYPTNQQGEAEIPLVNGEYPVTIEKTGYDTLQGTIKVNNQNADVTFEMDFFLYNVEFNISQVNQGNPAEGATISIDGNDTITTGQDGIATINLSTGTHTYAYSKTGFLNGTGNVRIEEAEKSVQITLVPGATVTFHTKVGNSALADVKIIVGQSSARALPETIVTNSQGIAAIDLPTGIYPEAEAIYSYCPFARRIVACPLSFVITALLPIEIFTPSTTFPSESVTLK